MNVFSFIPHITSLVNPIGFNYKMHSECDAFLPPINIYPLCSKYHFDPVSGFLQQHYNLSLWYSHCQVVFYLLSSQSDSFKMYHIIPLYHTISYLPFTFKIKAHILKYAHIICPPPFHPFEFIAFMFMQHQSLRAPCYTWDMSGVPWLLPKTLLKQLLLDPSFPSFSSGSVVRSPIRRDFT